MRNEKRTQKKLRPVRFINIFFCRGGGGGNRNTWIRKNWKKRTCFTKISPVRLCTTDQIGNWRGMESTLLRALLQSQALLSSSTRSMKWEENCPAVSKKCWYIYIFIYIYILCTAHWTRATHPHSHKCAHNYCIYVYIYIYTHTHTYIHIYIYIMRIVHTYAHLFTHFLLHRHTYARISFLNSS